jgi:hypothetical protein
MTPETARDASNVLRYIDCIKDEIYSLEKSPLKYCLHCGNPDRLNEDLTDIFNKAHLYSIRLLKAKLTEAELYLKKLK